MMVGVGVRRIHDEIGLKGFKEYGKPAQNKMH
jgi:hypothetical protein